MYTSSNVVSVDCHALPYFSKLSLKLQVFVRLNIEHKMCILIVSTNFNCNISHSKKDSAKYIIINVQGSTFKVPVLLVGF
jgi:hypothetical protein